MSRNPKLWIALGVLASVVAVAAIAGANVVALLPLLLVLACPVGMVVMMGGMAGMGRGKRAAKDEEPVAEPIDSDEVARLRAEVAQLRDHAAR